MRDGQSSISRKSLWTMGTYVASAALRFGGNIVLSRLLGPEIMGIAVIAQAVRTGSELLTDFGFEQNVVRSAHGDDADFLNTIWTIQIARGLLVSLACLALSPLLAAFYRIDTALLVTLSIAPLLGSLVSTSVFSMARRMDVRTRNLFELTVEMIGLGVTIGLALWLRNAWAPVLAILLSVAIRSSLTYFLPRQRHRLRWERRHIPEILHLSKWIMLSSLAFYAAVYIDRLYLGRMVPLAMLGVYGLARSVADLPNTVAGRLAFQIVFPFVARNDADLSPGGAARGELVRARRAFLILVLLGVATVMAWADQAVLRVYGDRYAAAGWMLCLLLAGSWIAVMASLNEAAVYGGGRARNVSTANLLRFGTMLVVLPIGFHLGGLPAALLALPASEAMRYGVLMRVQRRIDLSFLREDAVLTLAMLALFGGWVVLRLALGLGVPWAMAG